MPAGIVHALHGERLWKRLEKEHRVLKEHLVKDAFEWGKQGPDFLFCHRFFPWQKGENLRELGGKLLVMYRVSRSGTERIPARQ